MNKDILIVEDSTTRLKHLVNFIIGYSFDVAFTANEAINQLKQNKYKYIMLDHDLADQHYEIDVRDMNPELLEKTGQHVADYIAYNHIDLDLVIIHSLNPVGCQNMFNVLTRHCINVVNESGCWNNYNHIEAIFKKYDIKE